VTLKVTCVVPMGDALQKVSSSSSFLPRVIRE
jgi:hypothetical protein